MKWLRGALLTILAASCGSTVGTPLAAPTASTPTIAPLATLAVKSSDPNTYELTCGVLSQNTITSGQGSGPNTFELRPATSLRAGTFSSALFGGWVAPDRPAFGTYVCLTLARGAPSAGFLSQVHVGDPGYIAAILPNGFALPQNCAYVGQPTSDADGLSVVWKVDCGATANRNARGMLGPALTQQGWVSCGNGLATEIWTNANAQIVMAEGSGAAGEYPMLTQRLSSTNHC